MCAWARSWKSYSSTHLSPSTKGQNSSPPAAIRTGTNTVTNPWEWMWRRALWTRTRAWKGNFFPLLQPCIMLPLFYLAAQHPTAGCLHQAMYCCDCQPAITESTISITKEHNNDFSSYFLLIFCVSTIMVRTQLLSILIWDYFIVLYVLFNWSDLTIC